MGVAQLPVAQKFSSIIVAHKYGQKQKILLKETYIPTSGKQTQSAIYKPDQRVALRTTKDKSN